MAVTLSPARSFMIARVVSLLVVATLAACSKSPEPPVAGTRSPTETPAPSVGAAPAPASAAQTNESAGIAWRKGGVDAAFAAAKAESKPVFLYWGAKWCPPCNQVMATILNRQDFIERSRHFVPV